MCNTCYFRIRKQKKKAGIWNPRKAASVAKCLGCHENKLLSHGQHTLCNSCYQKGYRLDNHEELNQKQRIKRIEQPEVVRGYEKTKYSRHKSSIIKSNTSYQVARDKTDINWKLARRLRTRLGAAIKNNQKVGSAVKDLGCSVEFLKQYLESKFESGMTWENWGNGEGRWSIDHIIPLSRVDLTDREQFLKANHYTNLRPMWALQNIREGNRRGSKILVS